MRFDARLPYSVEPVKSHYDPLKEEHATSNIASRFVATSSSLALTASNSPVYLQRQSSLRAQSFDQTHESNVDFSIEGAQHQQNEAEEHEGSRISRAETRLSTVIEEMKSTVESLRGAAQNVFDLPFEQSGMSIAIL